MADEPGALMTRDNEIHVKLEFEEHPLLDARVHSRKELFESLDFIDNKLFGDRKKKHEERD